MPTPQESSLPSQQTVAGCVDQLTADGYTDWFRADPGGLRAATAGCVHAPETMRVAKVFRFEGQTNPDDEAIVFALECTQHGVKGTYTVPYGINTPLADLDSLRRLRSDSAETI